MNKKHSFSPLSFALYVWAQLAFSCLMFLSLVQSGYGQESPSPARPDATLQSHSYGDWTHRCLVFVEQDREKKEKKCDIFQSVHANYEGAPIELFTVSLVRASDRVGKVNWGLVVVMPLGLDIHLPSDFGFVVGKGKPFLTRFRNCSAQGCRVVIPVDGALLKRLRRASGAAGLFRLVSGKVVRVNFSLKGFSKAFSALDAGRVPVQKKSEKK